MSTVRELLPCDEVLVDNLDTTVSPEIIRQVSDSYLIANWHRLSSEQKEIYIENIEDETRVCRLIKSQSAIIEFSRAIAYLKEVKSRNPIAVDWFLPTLEEAYATLAKNSGSMQEIALLIELTYRTAILLKTPCQETFNSQQYIRVANKIENNFYRNIFGPACICLGLAVIIGMAVLFPPAAAMLAASLPFICTTIVGAIWTGLGIVDIKNRKNIESVKKQVHTTAHTFFNHAKENKFQKGMDVPPPPTDRDTNQGLRQPLIVNHS